MNITINIQAPELAHAIETLAIAIGCTVDKIGVGQAIQEAVNQAPTNPEVFEKDSYFYHPESESYAMWKKGQVIPHTDPDFNLCYEVTKEEYDKGTSKAPAAEEPKFTLEEVRKALGDLAKAKGKEIAKGVLTAFGVSKVTDLEKSQYNEAMKAIKEA